MGIFNLASTNVWLLPYLAHEGIWYVHYFAHRVRRQFGLDQDIPNDFTVVLDSTTSIHPFLHLVPLSFGVSFYNSHQLEFPESRPLYCLDAWLLAGGHDFIWLGVFG